MDKALAFNDITLIPQYSDIKSRLDVNTSTSLGKFNLENPIISANMDCVTNARMAIAMRKLGGVGILHRFYKSDQDRKMDIHAYFSEMHELPIFSIGVSKEEIDFAVWVSTMYSMPIHVCVDIAHGHSLLMAECIDRLRKELHKDSYIIAGNVCTYKGAEFLVNLGVDAIKVGVGPGSNCKTRTVTGHGIPQISAIQECNLAIGHGIVLIADGGITNSGDICKAIACGADLVMVGRLLAGCNESAAPYAQHISTIPYYANGVRHMGYCDTDDTRYKVYRGQSSHEIQMDMETYRPGIASEGIVTNILSTGPLENTLNELVGGLRSGMAYSGTKTLKEFQCEARWLPITHNGYTEGTPHGKNN